MCFSAAASFTTSGLLLPVGILWLRKARKIKRGYEPIAAFPLLFGIQQAFEGLVWLSLGGNESIDGHTVALVYLFFAYVLWPFLVPLSAWRIEQGLVRRRLLLLLSLSGLAFGVLLYFPLLLDPDALQFRPVHSSIVYDTALVFDAMVPRSAGRVIYALLVAVPLILSGVRKVRFFGAIVLASMFLSALVFEYAFASVWCFFAALISVYIVQLMNALSARADFDCIEPVPSEANTRKAG
jgi:hypothetical protein